MKVVILAGGYGTRLSEETQLKPKPMIEIGGMPILWHIMKIYSHYGLNDFLICLGYKGYVIKEFFANYFLHMSDVTISLAENKIEVHNNKSEPWRVSLIETGEGTMTGGRLGRVRKYLGDETFCMTYGDGVGDVDINKLLEQHKASKRLATLTAVQPPGRFGSLRIDKSDRVKSFQEKPEGDGAWINGGFFVLEPGVFDLISDDQCVWEREPLEKLAQMNQLNSYKHEGFWKPMDTLRDKNQLEEMWAKKTAPWRLWE